MVKLESFNEEVTMSYEERDAYGMYYLFRK